jgi:hypothetical protein
MTEPLTRQEAAARLKSLSELAEYISNRGIDAYLGEDQFLRLAKIVTQFSEAGFSERELDKIRDLAGINLDQMQALWLAYEWQVSYNLRTETSADVSQMSTLHAMFNQVMALREGAYYLSKEEKTALHWFNEEADLGENNRLYLLKIASKAGLEPAHLLYLRRLAGRRPA